jgi:thioredoxin reductase (NADPH)
MRSPSIEVDCVIVGGGPAGLAASIYLARYHLAVATLDDGASRAALIPTTHNHAGFPDGIPGEELVARMRCQAENFGARIYRAKAEKIMARNGGFDVDAGEFAFTARKVLLATGVKNRRPPMPPGMHDEAVRRGLLRYCPVCDGYEVTDRRIAVLGSGEHALREAQFLRSFSRDVTIVLPDAAAVFGPELKRQAADWNISVLSEPCGGLRIEAGAIVLDAGAKPQSFDTLYAALGTDIRSELASAAGAKLSKDGAIVVDDHQMTSVDGLYAAGDVVVGIDQISNAMGQAGIAATAMRNSICEAHPLKR